MYACTLRSHKSTRLHYLLNNLVLVNVRPTHLVKSQLWGHFCCSSVHELKVPLKVVQCLHVYFYAYVPRGNVNLVFPKAGAAGHLSFWLLSFLAIVPISFSPSFNLHMRCYLGPLNQVTNHSCLCPWEDRVLSTVRTHCSTSEEEEMKRLEVARTAVLRPLNRRRDKRGKGEKEKTGV